ncbi:histidinol dehydrogenase [Abditibacterium utsteinense]|uniref:Histidinol dehydrogenase n=1 Tax=Abditibacterium utsteinense TaxID=1960156 RepID=A0A2S8SQR2_9BACT|nr:histidinol dehydrogenase [Abditibacterium utsteinense]PQV63130.1 histidinol dehydrogenase [Abditibacterium utsteinense]
MKFIEGTLAARAAILEANAARAFSSNPQIEAVVREICEAIASRGDEALLEWTRKLDSAALNLDQIRVSKAEIEAAMSALPAPARTALERAAKNIETFHSRQTLPDWSFTSADGALLGQRTTPIERVGLYAPNGRAAYPSTVLMLAMPAQVAGVKQIALATPASLDGMANPTILAAAHIAGIEEIYKIGGAVAMAAFAYGTDTVQKVDKIVGPANIYGTLAKKYLYGIVGIDGLYGPSDAAIVADVGANPAQLAADLIAQAEHGGDSFVCLLTASAQIARDVQSEIEVQLLGSLRAKILVEALENGLICHVDSLNDACEMCDLLAAEHVEIWSRDAFALSARIPNAGAIFINTPVPIGDYIAGPSHALPTGATARFASGVGVDTFLKRTSLVSAPRESIAGLADDLETIALLEELPGHAAAVRRAAA